MVPVGVAVLARQDVGRAPMTEGGASRTIAVVNITRERRRHMYRDQGGLIGGRTWHRVPRGLLVAVGGDHARGRRLWRR